MIAVSTCKIAGKMNVMRQAVEDCRFELRKREYKTGMKICVKPEPTLAQPAATPLATPTTHPENMELIQNWFATKFAREKPMKKRMTIKAQGVDTRDMDSTTGAVRRESVADAKRGPKRSHAGPMARREKIEPRKEAMPALPMSEAVRLRSFLMMGRSGGMEKVQKKVEKRDIHARWKARMCGGDIVNGRNSVALLSESTGNE